MIKTEGLSGITEKVGQIQDVRPPSVLFLEEGGWLNK